MSAEKPGRNELKEVFHAAMENDIQPVSDFVSTHPESIDVPCVAKPFMRKSLLMTAIQSRGFDVAEMLIDAGADVHYRVGPTSVLSAAVGMANSSDQETKASWVSLMTKLLQAGADPNAPCARGTVLSFALLNYSRHFDNYWIVALLLEHGGDMNLKIEKLGTTLQQFVDQRASPKWASPGLLNVLGVTSDRAE